MNRPVTSTAPTEDRIVVVDALRAFALFGIIVTHACIGFLVGPKPTPDFMSFSDLDRVMARWVPIVIEGKFFAIFSFLFGLSFAIQLDRARRAGRPFAGRFAWRLIVLMGIGFVHSLFFGGDILMIYALLGLLLLPVHKLRTRTLVITALVLILNLPLLVMGSLFLAAPPPVRGVQSGACLHRAHPVEHTKARHDAREITAVARPARGHIQHLGIAGFQIQDRDDTR